MEERTGVYTDEQGRRVVPASALKRVIQHQHLKLADGTIIETGSCALNAGDNTLWVWVDASSGMDMLSLFPIFNNVSKTSRIESKLLDTDTPTVYENYTEMINIRTDNAGRTTINLRYRAPVN